MELPKFLMFMMICICPSAYADIETELKELKVSMVQMKKEMVTMAEDNKRLIMKVHEEGLARSVTLRRKTNHNEEVITHVQEDASKNLIKLNDKIKENKDSISKNEKQTTDMLNKVNDKIAEVKETVHQTIMDVQYRTKFKDKIGMKFEDVLRLTGRHDVQVDKDMRAFTLLQRRYDHFRQNYQSKWNIPYEEVTRLDKHVTVHGYMPYNPSMDNLMSSNATSEDNGVKKTYCPTFTVGDGTGGTEQYFDILGSNCISHCTNLKKTNNNINGVTVLNGDLSQKGCFCEIGATTHNENKDYQTCFISEYDVLQILKKVDIAHNTFMSNNKPSWEIDFQFIINECQRDDFQADVKATILKQFKKIQYMEKLFNTNYKERWGIQFADLFKLSKKLDFQDNDKDIPILKELDMLFKGFGLWEPQKGNRKDKFAGFINVIKNRDDKFIEDTLTTMRNIENAAPFCFDKGLGCWKDTSARAIPTLEGIDRRLDGDYKTRHDAIRKCYQAARERGYKVFAVQDGGQCFSSKNAGDTYKTYGPSSVCSGGKGGGYANDVYEITGPLLSFSHTVFKFENDNLYAEGLLRIHHNGNWCEISNKLWDWHPQRSYSEEAGILCKSGGYKSGKWVTDGPHVTRAINGTSNCLLKKLTCARTATTIDQCRTEWGTLKEHELTLTVRCYI